MRTGTTLTITTGIALVVLTGFIIALLPNAQEVAADYSPEPASGVIASDTWECVTLDETSSIPLDGGAPTLMLSERIAGVDTGDVIVDAKKKKPSNCRWVKVGRQRRCFRAMDQAGNLSERVCTPWRDIYEWRCRD